jgi:DNA polymerase-3 subunit delta'
MIGLNDIIGQEPALQQLHTAMRDGRMPHAFLFIGPAGVGRRTTALALAATLLCKKKSGDPPQACGTCEDCKMLAAGTHSDFQLIYKELARFHDDSSVRNRVMQDLGIDVIRHFLIGPAGRAPTRGSHKVFVVLETELMSIAAQNSLLKTLEEPPPGVTIILICAKPDQLLPTTLSRCAQVNFRRLPAAFVAQKLEEFENGIAPSEARFWAGYTQGSIGEALKLARAGMYEIKCDVLNHLARLSSGGDVDTAEHFADLTDKLATQAVSAAKKRDGAELSKSLASRQATGTMLEIIAGVYGDALTLATGARRDLTHSDQSSAVEIIAGRFTPTQLACIIESLSQYEQLLWRNVNPKIVWDNVVITCGSGQEVTL